jgi:ABC-type cobalamin transport system ATPase subunit
VAAVDSIGDGARTRAAAAIADYQQALGALQAAVQSGQSAASIADASRATVLRLQGLIATIAGGTPTEAARRAATKALERLSQADLALSRALLSLDAVRAAQAEGFQVLGALCVVDRGEGGSEALAEAGIPLRSLFVLSDLRL